MLWSETLFIRGKTSSTKSPGRFPWTAPVCSLLWDFPSWGERDGKLPSWGSGEEYKEKLNKGDIVFLRKEKTTIFKYDEDVLSSEILILPAQINPDWLSIPALIYKNVNFP